MANLIICVVKTQYSFFEATVKNIRWLDLGLSKNPNNGLIDENLK